MRQFTRVPAFRKAFAAGHQLPGQRPFTLPPQPTQVLPSPSPQQIIRMQQLDTGVMQALSRSAPTESPGISRAVLPGQAKLALGAPHDKYEQAADCVAEQTQLSAPQGKSPQRSPAVQREVAPEEEELQMKPLAAAITPLGPGAPLIPAAVPAEPTVHRLQGRALPAASHASRPARAPAQPLIQRKIVSSNEFLSANINFISKADDRTAADRKRRQLAEALIVNGLTGISDFQARAKSQLEEGVKQAPSDSNADKEKAFTAAYELLLNQLMELQSKVLDGADELLNLLNTLLTKAISKKDSTSAVAYTEGLAYFQNLKKTIIKEAVPEFVDMALGVRESFAQVKATSVDQKRAGKYNDDHMRTVKSKFGSGNVNEVALLEDSLTQEQFVFKGDRTEADSAVLKNIGVDLEKDAKFSNRAVAMYRLSQLLADPDQDGDASFNVIPPTYFATHEGLVGHVMKFVPGKAGQSSQKQEHDTNNEGDKAYQNLYEDQHKEVYEKGNLHEALNLKELKQTVIKEEGKYYKPTTVKLDIDLARPDVQEGLTALQLIDLISGQVDRHPGNYIYEKDSSGKIQVWGIDNDAAFGKKHTTLKDNQDPWKMKGSHLPKGLAAVSAKHANRILAVTPEQIQATLGDLLSPEEVEATIMRLKELQIYLLDHWPDVVFKDYNQETFAEMQNQGRDLSYVGRDANTLAEGRYLAMEFEPIAKRANVRSRAEARADLPAYHY